MHDKLNHHRSTELTILLTVDGYYITLVMHLCLQHDNNNNSHDNVYGAVIMTKVIARVHPVHLMNVD